MLVSFIKKRSFTSGSKNTERRRVYNTSEGLVGGGKEVGAGKESFKVFLNTYIQDQKTLKAHQVHMCRKVLKSEGAKIEVMI